KSLATGHGYRWLNLPGTPPAPHFPPGYPAVLALLWQLAPAFPANVVLFKLANALFMAVAAAATFSLSRKRLELSTPTPRALPVSAARAEPPHGRGADVRRDARHPDVDAQHHRDVRSTLPRVCDSNPPRCRATL